MEYSLTPDDDSTQSLSITPESTTLPPTPEVAQKRAVKASYALNQDYDTTLAQLSSGGEDFLRKQTAASADIQWQQQRNMVLRDMVGRQGRNFSPTQLDVLQSMSRQDYQTDPATVFEKKFAQKTINDNVVENASSNPEGLWGKAFKENPTATAQNLKLAAEQFAKSEYIGKKVDDLTQESEQLGYLSKAWNFVKAVTPGVSWYNQTRILKDAPWSGLSLPGTTKREQVQHILSLPLPEAVKAIDSSIETLKGINIEDARAFAEALQSYTSSQQFMDSGTGVADLASLPYKTAARILKVAGRGTVSIFKGTPRAAELVTDDLARIPPIKEVQQEIFRQKAPEVYAESPYKTQPDLFEGDPRQGDLFGFPRSTKPDATAGLPPGKLRSTYKPIAQQEVESADKEMLVGRSLATGRFEPGSGAYTQLPLDLKGGVGQRSFNFDTPATRATARVDSQIALNDIQKAAEEVSPGSGRLPPTSGNFVSEAIYGAMERLQKAKEGTMRLAEGLPSYADPGNYFGNSRSLTNAFINEAVQVAQGRRNTFEAIVDQSQRITRVPKEVEEQAFNEAKGKLFDRFSQRFSDGVLDVVHLPSYMFKSNVGQAVMRLGRMDKTIFTSREAADLYAKDMYKLGEDEYRIYMDKSNYYIGLPTSIAENSDGTLNVFARIKNAVDTNIFTLLSKFRVADDYLTAAHSAQRKVAAHGQQSIRDMVRSTAQTFTNLGQKGSKEVEAVINDFGNQRKWYDTAAKFEDAFLSRHKKLASPEQIEAAFVYKQLQDSDFMIRNLGVYRDMARQGAEQFSIRSSKGVIEPFNGIQHDKLPWGRSEDFTFAVVKPSEEPKMGWGHQADRAEGKVTKAELEDLIDKEGYKVIQVFAPSEKPLSKLFPDLSTPVNYIVTKTHDAKPLKWEQLKYEPGPHSIYPYEYYIKQPVLQTGHLGKTYYYGDNTLWNFSSEAEAKMWLGRLNTARVLYNAKDPAFDAYLAKNLPFTKDEFQSFRNQFDFQVSFSYTQSGKSVFETQTDLEKLYPDAINFHKSSHNPQNFMDRAFIQERNQLLQNPSDAGGILQIQQAKQLDAYTALQRGLNQSIRGMWMNDYKVGASLQWLENYSDLFNVDLKNLRAAPLYYLYNADSLWKNVAKTEDAYSRLIAAKAERDAIVNFIGQSSEIGSAVTVLQNKVMNSIFDKLGTKIANYFADYHLGLIKDPVPFFRGLAAHTKIGLFNPIAGIQQAMVLGNIAAITSPKYAASSVAAGFMMNGLTHTAEEAIFNAAAKKLTTFGWAEEHAKEMLRAYRETGLNTVGAEAAFRADTFDNRLFRGTAGTFMDKGFLFFNMGERLGRKASFAAAYQEWRGANATAKLTDEAMAGILNRADTMTGNMTSASLANIQNGVLSIPLQFTTYFKHMAELMLGSRITTMEKARLFGVNSMLFGIPTAAGVGGIPGAVGGFISGIGKESPQTATDVPGAIATGIGHGLGAAVGMWPIYDDIKEEAYRRGYKMDNKFIKALAEGIPAMLISLVTDKNVSVTKTYGAGGSSIIRDMLRQDKGFVETMFGASGSVIGDIVGSVEPVMHRLAEAFGSGATFGEPQPSDLMKVLRNIGTADLAVRTYGAFAYHKYITKQGVEVGGLDTMDAALMALRLSPEKVDNIYLARNVMKDQKEQQMKYENYALESLRRANTNATQGDWKQYDSYLKDAQAYMKLGDFGPADQTRIFKRAVDESRGIEDNTARQFLKKAPESLYINRYNQYFTKQGNK